MNRKSKILLGLLLFNGLSATGGGLALMTDWIPEQASWVRDTDFPSNYFPGVILMAVVGGSSNRRGRPGETQRRLAAREHCRRDHHGVLDHRRDCVDPWIPSLAGDLPRDRCARRDVDTSARFIE